MSDLDLDLDNLERVCDAAEDAHVNIGVYHDTALSPGVLRRLIAYARNAGNPGSPRQSPDDGCTKVSIPLVYTGPFEDYRNAWRRGSLAGYNRKVAVIENQLGLASPFNVLEIFERYEADLQKAEERAEEADGRTEEAEGRAKEAEKCADAFESRIRRLQLYIETLEEESGDLRKSDARMKGALSRIDEVAESHSGGDHDSKLIQKIARACLSER